VKNSKFWACRVLLLADHSPDGNIPTTTTMVVAAAAAVVVVSGMKLARAHCE